MGSRVVIVGGGFGGLHAAKTLGGASVEVTVIDRRNFHLFQPLLYQVATGGLSPGDITSPIRRILRRHENIRVLMADVTDIDVERRMLRLGDRPDAVPYDTLIVATGVRHQYFGHDDWERHAPGLKTIEDATEMRRRILSAFERAERTDSPDERRVCLTFVVVGAGPTGVELAGALGELANDTLRRDFRAFDPGDAEIILVEGGDRVLGAYPGKLSSRAMRSLEKLGVTVMTGAVVDAVTAEGVRVRTSGGERMVGTRCVLWAAGVSGSPLAARLAEQTGAAVDRVGRIPVTGALHIDGHPDLFVIGDLASVRDAAGEELPGVAQVAMQQGRYVGRLIRARERGRLLPKPFRYLDRGSMATIGRSAAVADFGFLRFSGLPAWLLWLGVHLAFLIEFENRILVLVQWAWNYFTRNRGARLIAGPPSAPPPP